MRLVLLGAPGSGKGTQAARLKEELNVPHISTGEMLRSAVAAGSELGLKAKAVMDAGHLVSDDIMLGILEDRLEEPDAANGFILDGYPRNLTQVEALDSLLERLHMPLDTVVKLEVPSEEIIKRCEERYEAEGRADDNPEVVRKRLRIYAEQTAPVADWYDQRDMLRSVDGVGSLDAVFAHIMNALAAAGLTANG